MISMNINNNLQDSPGGHSRVRAMASNYSNGPKSPSHIPLPKYTSTLKIATDSSPAKYQWPHAEQNGNESRWKARYEETERKRKLLFTESQKCARDYSNLERRYKELNNDFNSKQHQLEDRVEQLNKLRKASEAVYTEYEKLRSKYEVETGAMHSAMKTASQWYSQNRELKRKSAVLVQKFLQVSPSGVIDLDDDTDASGTSSTGKEDDELAGLRSMVKELSEEVARLQTELKTARLQEFEAQEQVVNLTSQLEEQHSAYSQVQGELDELRVMKQNMGHVSKLVAVEMASLREQCQQEREVALRMKSEANVAQKERNVLAHQSTLLLSDVVGDEKFLLVLQEVERLKRQLEEKQQQHILELQELQDRVEEREAEAQLELLEEKLKLSESELQCALQRAERAESHSNQLNSKVNQLEGELEILKCPPPPPPPPLPPPPPAAVFSSVGTLRKQSITDQQVVVADSSTGNPVLDMANMLGIPHKPANKLVAVQTGAIDDIINQIKGGRFTLKTTEKQKNKKEETPAAVQEMLSILGTLKRRPKTSRQSTSSSSSSNRALADVAL